MLSAYGKRLQHVRDSIRDRQRRAQVHTPLIGLVVEQEAPDTVRPWDTQMKYRVTWIDDCKHNPKGREYWAHHFHRKDLKLLSRA